MKAEGWIGSWQDKCAERAILVLLLLLITKSYYLFKKCLCQCVKSHCTIQSATNNIKVSNHVLNPPHSYSLHTCLHGGVY